MLALQNKTMNEETTPIDKEAFSRAIETSSKLLTSLQKVIMGRDDTLKLVLTGLFSDGHVLIEDFPGSGKTTLSKTLGRLIDFTDNHHQKAPEYIAGFRRIQFTPDLLPGDILGVNIYEPKNSSFRLIHGPIFSHIILADEINRTGPKVQAAFLECMAEKQVTIDSVTYPLDSLFFVLGTQNPLDMAGTYPLPTVQLDRFLLKIPMSYVTENVEKEIVLHSESIKNNAGTLAPVVSRASVLEAQRACKNVTVSPHIIDSIVELVRATRSSSIIQYGASTRAAIMLKSALQSFALLSGRNYVTEDDFKFLSPFVLLHRIKTQGGAKSSDVFESLLLPVVEKLVKKGL